MIDYLPQDTSTFGIYDELKTLDWSGIHCIFNIQDITKVKLPPSCHRAAISFHTEYYHVHDLLDFFNAHQDVEFLFLSDGIPKCDWPINVTYCQWVTWHLQLEKLISIYGVNKEDRKPKYAISALSARGEFHKASIVSYLFAKMKDRLIYSWYKMEPLYFNKEEIERYPRLQTYLDYGVVNSIPKYSPDDWKENESATPIDNGNWHMVAYTDAVINLTNESIFNSSFMYRDTVYNYTTPYLTEKTFKALAARQPFLPVGQVDSIKHLSELGLNFDYGLPLEYDCENGDFDRIEKIYDTIDYIENMSVSELFNQTQPIADYNLNMIETRQFSRNCINDNMSRVTIVENWINSGK